MKHYTQKNEGIVLVVTLMVMAILLGLSASILNLTLKQYQIAGVGLASEMAFQAASAGMECALYYDTSDVVGGVFDIPPTGSGGGTMNCFEDSANSPGGFSNGQEQRFDFDWGSPELCTEFSVYKFYDASSDVPLIVDGVNVRPSNDCPAGAVCTVVKARGYNVACVNRSTNPKVVERELTVVY